MAFCPKCGNQLTDGAAFCPKCGASQSASGGATPGAGGGQTAAGAQRARIEAEIKARSQDAMQAVKVLMFDPVGGLAKSFALFDGTQAKIVGAIFGGVYAVAITIGAALMWSSGAGYLGMMMGGGIGGFGGLSSSIPFGVAIRVFICGLVVFAALALAQMLIRLIFKAAGDMASDVYLAGACLLPGAVGMLAGSLLGLISGYLSGLCFLFALCYGIVMLFTGALQVGKLSEGKAALSVPIMCTIVMLVLYIVAKIIPS